jgi:hypothetical protein
MTIWGLEEVCLLIKLYANLSMNYYRQLIIIFCNLAKATVCVSCSILLVMLDY